MLNIALNLSLEFGPDWRKPIQERLRSQCPDVTQQQADDLNAVVTSARDWAHELIRSTVNERGSNEDQARGEIRLRYPWIDEETLGRLWSQGMYYAMK